MKNVLVTGGTGFIGSHTALALYEAGYLPILLDNLDNSESIVIDSLEKICGIRFPFFNDDCRNPDVYATIYDQYPYDSIIHFAAHKAVGESVIQPLKYFDNNINGCIVLLQAMKRLNIKNLIFSSSCTVYGNPENSMVTEQTPLAKPESPYGYTKLVCEQMIEQVINSNSKISASLLRYFNPIGAHESGFIGEKPCGIPNNLVPYITQTAAGKREFLSVFGNDYPTPDGTCIRDFIHVCDVADAHVAALNHLQNENAPALFKFNIGTGKGTSVLELISSFEKSTGIKLNWKFAARRPGDVVEIFANTDLSNTILQWKAKRNINDAMRDAWNWELSSKE